VAIDLGGPLEPACIRFPGEREHLCVVMPMQLM
jgi:hypothetical protein